MIPKQVLRLSQLTTPRVPIPNANAVRLFSTTPAHSSNSHSSAPKLHTADPRWLALMKRRIGRCMMFGLKPGQVTEAGGILQVLARDWRELIAGSEGYLTDETRRGLYRHNVVWGEMDVMAQGHVNNVTYVRYAETARVNYTRKIGTYIDPANKKQWLNLINSTGIGLILRSIKVDYKFPMKYPDKITVYHKLVHDPTASPSPFAFELQVMILSEARQRPAARCHEDIVTYDYKAAKKTQLPPYMMEQFKSTWRLQEEAKKSWQQRVMEIENQVRTLELESWDRADAVEDTGSAKK